MSQQAFVLELPSGRRIGVTSGQRLSAEDVLGLRSTGRDGFLAAVDANPQDPTVLGLRNLSDTSWTVAVDGGSRTIDSGKTIRLGVARRIELGAVTGAVSGSGAAFSLGLASGAVALAKSTKVSAAELLGVKAQGANPAVAEVEPHPRDPTVVGLKNLSGRDWEATRADGQRVPVPNGRSVRLADGLSIDIGEVRVRVAGGGATAAPPPPQTQGGTSSRGTDRKLGGAIAGIAVVAVVAVAGYAWLSAGGNIVGTGGSGGSIGSRAGGGTSLPSTRTPLTEADLKPVTTRVDCADKGSSEQNFYLVCTGQPKKCRMQAGTKAEACAAVPAGR